MRLKRTRVFRVITISLSIGQHLDIKGSTKPSSKVEANSAAATAASCEPGVGAGGTWPPMNESFCSRSFFATAADGTNDGGADMGASEATTTGGDRAQREPALNVARTCNSSPPAPPWSVPWLRLRRRRRAIRVVERVAVPIAKRNRGTRPLFLLLLLLL